MLKPCATVLVLMLLLYTSCYGWCSEPRSVAISQSSAAGQSPPCHSTREEGEQRESEPVHNDESCDDCFLQVAEHKGSLNSLTADPAAFPAETPVSELRQHLLTSIADTFCIEFSGSPPARPVLRI